MSRSLPDALHRDLFDRSADGILVTRGDRILIANDAAARLVNHGSTPDRLVNQSLIELASPASRTTLTAWLAAFESASAPGVCEARFGSAGVDVELAGASLADGLLQVTARDISERRRAEAALRANEERLTLAFAGAQE